MNTLVRYHYRIDLSVLIRYSIPALGHLNNLVECDRALYQILLATLRHEKAVAERDREVLRVQKSTAPVIDKAAADIAALEADVQALYVANRKNWEADGRKSLELPNGLLSMRDPPSPALLPLNKLWSWPKIEAALRKTWQSRYFHKPKPPGLDKVMLKKELTPAQLKDHGMKLDDSETFHIDLNRLTVPDEIGEAA